MILQASCCMRCMTVYDAYIDAPIFAFVATTHT